VYFAGDHPHVRWLPIGVDTQPIGAATFIADFAGLGSLHVIAPRAMSVIPILVRASLEEAVFQVIGCIFSGLVVDVLILWFDGHDVWRFSWADAQTISSTALVRYLLASFLALRWNWCRASVFTIFDQISGSKRLCR
jgi:hypothetical protein